ncbi:hypothetical protein B0O99DRAFT_281018 [Bisporella sp. PMI_857]|nr:hypothetical protein B0O99DRAFT_281018 [Bisporella sp. PMI_857]
MKLTTSGLAVLGLATISNAHMLLAHPPPYPDQNLSNGPLAADGSDFPCKSSSYTGGTTTTLTPGSSQPLDFTGTAVHGGGSCQISITYDAVPNKQSTWKVLHSYISGCPAEGTNENVGNDASKPRPFNYPFEIDERLPAGKATLAWSWINKIGNREFYMNCAPVEVGGSSSDQAYLNSLPNMFVANIQMPTGFPGTTVEGTDVIFPNPGEYVTYGNQGTLKKDYNKAADPPADVIRQLPPAHQLLKSPRLRHHLLLLFQQHLRALVAEVAVVPPRLVQLAL